MHLAPPGSWEGDCLPFIPPGLKGFADARVLCAFCINTYFSVKISAGLKLLWRRAQFHSCSSYFPPQGCHENNKWNHMDDDLVRSHQQSKSRPGHYQNKRFKIQAWNLPKRLPNFYTPSWSHSLQLFCNKSLPCKDFTQLFKFMKDHWKKNSCTNGKNNESAAQFI